MELLRMHITKPSTFPIQGRRRRKRVVGRGVDSWGRGGEAKGGGGIIYELG